MPRLTPEQRRQIHEQRFQAQAEKAQREVEFKRHLETLPPDQRRREKQRHYREAAKRQRR